MKGLLPYLPEMDYLENLVDFIFKFIYLGDTCDTVLLLLCFILPSLSPHYNCWCLKHFAGQLGGMVFDFRLDQCSNTLGETCTSQTIQQRIYVFLVGIETLFRKSMFEESWLETWYEILNCLYVRHLMIKQKEYLNGHHVSVVWYLRSFWPQLIIDGRKSNNLKMVGHNNVQLIARLDVWNGIKHFSNCWTFFPPSTDLQSDSGLSREYPAPRVERSLFYFVTSCAEVS